MVTTTTRRAVAYQRVSTAEQSGERHVSLETQAGRIAAYSERQGWPVVSSFTDVMTGKRDDRVDYRRMLDFVRAGGADVIVVQFLDRFGRHPKEILSRIWELQEAGVTVEATDEDLKEELILLIKAGMAGMESKRISQRVVHTMREALMKDHTKKPGGDPYGYRRTATGWEIIPDEQATIRRMVELVTERNLGFYALAQALEAEGIRTRAGNVWRASMLQRLLNDTTLIGTFTYRKHSKHPDAEAVTIEGYFGEPVLDRETYDRLQQRLAIRRGTPKGHMHVSPYMLTGVARCAYCGGPLVGRNADSRGEKYRRYCCGRHAQAKALCAYPNGHAAPRLEAAVLEFLGEWTKPEKVRELVAAKPDGTKLLTSELEGTGKRLADVSRRSGRLLDQVEQGVLSGQAVRERLGALEEERAGLESRRADLEQRLLAQKAQADTAAAIPAKVGAFLTDVQNLGMRQNKARLQALVKAIYVWNDGRIELEWRS